MKKAVVILGAGASKDVNNGLSPKNSQLEPPLARDLFLGRFWPYMARYSGAEVLGAELAPLAASSGPFDLEEKLTEFANDTDPRTIAAFKHIPPYLRDVLVTVSRDYTESPSTYIALCRRLLRDQTHQILFLILNYDTLLEQALRRYDPTLGIRSFEEYVAGDRQALIAKVHGSVDWGIPMGAKSDWHAALTTFDLAGNKESLFLAEPKDARLTSNWHMPDGTCLYPRLTAPLRGKQFCCPDGITEAMLAFMSDCNKYLVIGTSGLDEDVLEALKQTGAGLGTHVHYVNPSATTVAERFEHHLPHINTFDSFVLTNGSRLKQRTRGRRRLYPETHWRGPPHFGQSSAGVP